MDARDRRLNEGLRDVQSIGENLDLPVYVRVDASRLLRLAAERRLPGGRMAWESLAAGAIMLAARRAGVPRETEEIAMFAKSTHERACAAARKIRMGCGLTREYPPVRSDAIDAVLVGLDDVLDARAVLEFSRLGRTLLELADEEPVGMGTPRMTIAAAAVYAADRVTSGKSVTQAQVAESASRVCATSAGPLGRYSRELHDAYEGKPERVAREVSAGSEYELV